MIINESLLKQARFLDKLEDNLAKDSKDTGNWLISKYEQKLLDHYKEQMEIKNDVV